jgi:hypothetical protein
MADGPRVRAVDSASSGDAVAKRRTLNGYTIMTPTKRPSLRHEDGAKFIAEIQEISGGYRASFILQLDHLSHVDTQNGDMQMFPTRQKAREWIHGCAAALEYPTIVWKGGKTSG